MGEQREVLHAILEISRQMAQMRALQPLLVYVMDISLELFEAEAGYLVLLKEDGTLDFRVQRTRNGTPPPPEERISKTIFYKVVNTGQPLLTGSALEDPALSDSSSVLLLALRSVMCVPLIAHDTVLGALYLENRRITSVFEADDLDLLQIFANQAAVAI